ncbi:hypothetical protein FACS1894154_11350 [Betaproteobacteria bacterium]|nr:hypothetical protein FACS1894154_11350 [Betaproteobacteria bacterium]
MDRLLKMEQRVNNALDNPRSGGYPSALPRTDEHGSLTNTEVEALIDARVKNAIVGVLQTLDAIEHPDDDVLA